MPPLGSASDVVAAGNYAYIADGRAGLRVLDVSDPATRRRREVGFYDPAVPVGDVLTLSP